MPRILLIADSDALWTKRAVEYLLLPAGYEIVIFPIWGHKGQFDNFYREHDVIVYRDPHRLPVIRPSGICRWAGVSPGVFMPAGSAPSGAATCCGPPTVPFGRCSPTCAAATV